MSDNGFGYVKIKNGMVVCYTGSSNNPTVHKFENEEIVNNSISCKRLQKEIAYAEWKIQQYEDNPGYADLTQQWTDTLAILQMIQGTHTHDPDYDQKFEEEYASKFLRVDCVTEES